MMTLENGVLHIETRTQTAAMENGRFTSLVSKATGKSYVAAPGGLVGSSILWMNGDCKRLDTGKVEVRLLGEDRAEFIFHSWYGGWGDHGLLPSGDRRYPGAARRRQRTGGGKSGAMGDCRHFPRT